MSDGITDAAHDPLAEDPCEPCEESPAERVRELLEGYCPPQMRPTAETQRRDEIIRRRYEAEALRDLAQDAMRPLVAQHAARSLDPQVDDRMLPWFGCLHLPADQREVGLEYAHIAARIASLVVPGPERTVALRRLLESRDAALRALLRPGG